MKWRTLLPIIIGFQLLQGVHVSGASSQPEVYLSSPVIPQGGLGLIRVRLVDGKPPKVTWMKKKIQLAPNNLKTVWYGFLGADLAAKPRRHEVLVAFNRPRMERRLEIEIREKDYGVRRLTLPKDKVDLDAASLKRARKESRIMKRLWNAPPSPPRWRGPFIRPVPGEVGGPFGRRSIINNQPRASHSGIDLRGKKGTPIKTTNSGVVVLTADHFFTGLSVVVDHGGGIQSMYFHMDEIEVQEGQTVSKGHVIGRIGSTGRATGPHLHWGVRVNGARVDPLRLTVLSRQLGEP